MMKSYSNQQPTNLALLFLSLALTASFTFCQNYTVTWEAPNSASDPLDLYAGTYSLPLTILATDMFPYPINLVSNDTRFVFASGFVIPYQGTYANDIMGCDITVPAGIYVINFSLSNTTWSGPGLLYVNVINTPITLDIDATVVVNGTTAAGPSFNLVSLDPYTNMTISASVSNGDFTVSPSSIVYYPNSTTLNFTYYTTSTTTNTSSAIVTFTITGADAAAYNLSQNTQIVQMPGALNSTTTNSTSDSNSTTNSTSDSNTTSNSTGTTNSTTNTTTNTSGALTTTSNSSDSSTTTNSTSGGNSTSTNISSGGSNSSTSDSNGGSSSTISSTGGDSKLRATSAGVLMASIVASIMLATSILL